MLGDGLVLGEGLVVGLLVGLEVGLLLAEGLAGGLALDEVLLLPVGLGLAVADGLWLLVGLGLAAGLVLACRRPVADRSMAPDSESTLSVSVGREPHTDFEPGGTSRVAATATPNILHERIEIPANVLSAINPARRILTGTAPPGWRSPRGLLCSPWLSDYACSGNGSPLSLFDTWATPLFDTCAGSVCNRPRHELGIRSRRLGKEGKTDSRDILTRPARPPDLVLRYGPGADHIADLRMPVPSAQGRRPDEQGWRPGEQGRRPGEQLAPLVLFLHGGFWRAAFDRVHTGPLAEALAALGFAVCTPEYRRTGQAGGGWPGTLDDVAAAADILPGLAAEATGGLTDPARVLLAGHSAGGQLALWAAGRHRLPPGAPWHLAEPVASGVVALAAVCDLTACFEQDLGHGAAAELIGGGPARYPDRYQAADPARLLPIGVPVRLVHGSADDRVPCEMSREYAALARAAGDDTGCAMLPGSGHFAVIDPLSAAWPQVVAAFCSPAFGPGPGTGTLRQP